MHKIPIFSLPFFNYAQMIVEKASLILGKILEREVRGKYIN